MDRERKKLEKLVKKKPYLTNRDHPDYYNRDKKRKDWENIAKSYNGKEWDKMTMNKKNDEYEYVKERGQYIAQQIIRKNEGESICTRDRSPIRNIQRYSRDDEPSSSREYTKRSIKVTMKETTYKGGPSRSRSPAYSSKED